MDDPSNGSMLLDTSDDSQPLASVEEFISSDEEPLSLVSGNISNSLQETKDPREPLTSTLTDSDSDTEEDERYAATTIKLVSNNVSTGKIHKEKQVKT